MPKRYTNKEIKNILEQYGCTLLSEYKNSVTEIKVKCSCGNIFYKKFKIMNQSKKFKCNECIKQDVIEKHIIPYEVVKNKVEKIGYELLVDKDEYSGINKKYKIKCNKGHEYEQIISDLLKGHKCKKCATEEVVSKFRESLDNIKEILNNKGLILLSDNYQNGDTHMTVKCKKCGFIFYPTMHNIKSGSNCPKCNKIKQSKNQIIPYEKRKKYVEKFNFKIITPKEEYIDISHDIILQCDKGHKYETKLKGFLSGNRCPICNKSKGEVKICSVLKKYNLKFKQEYIFKNCKYKRYLRFDFYLPKHNVCIEYDGKQHYEIDCFNGDLWNFVDIKIKDTIKNIYCKDNNIKLIRIPYWDIDKIENILIKQLKL